jgi:hypothetical protein
VPALVYMVSKEIIFKHFAGWFGWFCIPQRAHFPPPPPLTIGSIDEGLNLVSSLSSPKRSKSYSLSQKHVFLNSQNEQTKHACVLTYFT